MFTRRVVLSLVLALIALMTLSGCATNRAAFTPAVAQPNARPMRNFTSFSDSLRCMDRLFAQLPARRYLVSSSDIPDETRGIYVGADDMLINALNQMNRTSRRYVFLDQARISGFGQLELVTTRKKGEVKPDLYIRGSISQHDSDTVDNRISAGHDSKTGRGISTSLYRSSRTLSIVSVDLHLVQYPSRQILAGGSVSNSMVVAKRGLNGIVGGMIGDADIAVPITIERVESQGQAVRNLIELGLLELLGKHAGVPYWQCLGIQNTDARAAEKRERKFVMSGPDITQMQRQLAALSYLQAPISGKLDGPTRQAVVKFQVAQNLIANGIPDFDVVERLNTMAIPQPSATIAKAAGASAKPKRPAPTASPANAAPAAKRPAATQPIATSPQCVEGQNCEGLYKNLYDFIKEDVDF